MRQSSGTRTGILCEVWEPNGGPLTGGSVTALQHRPGRVQSHLQLLGILWFAISAFNAIGGVVLYILANTLFAHLHEMVAPPEAPVGFLRPLLSVIGIFVLAKAAVGFMAGWGLMYREPWAR